MNNEPTPSEEAGAVTARSRSLDRRVRPLALKLSDAESYLLRLSEIVAVYQRETADYEEMPLKWWHFGVPGLRATGRFRHFIEVLFRNGETHVLSYGSDASARNADYERIAHEMA